MIVTANPTRSQLWIEPSGTVHEFDERTHGAWAVEHLGLQYHPPLEEDHEGFTKDIPEGWQDDFDVEQTGQDTLLQQGWIRMGFFRRGHAAVVYLQKHTPLTPKDLAWAQTWIMEHPEWQGPSIDVQDPRLWTIPMPDFLSANKPAELRGHKTAAGPIPLDTKLIDRVYRAVVSNIKGYWGNYDAPIGERELSITFSLNSTPTNVSGEERQGLNVKLVFEDAYLSKAVRGAELHPGKWPTLVVYLSGKLTGQDITKRLEGLEGFYLRGILVHELAHVFDHIPDLEGASVNPKDEAEAYYNLDTEIHAYATQLWHYIVTNADYYREGGAAWLKKTGEKGLWSLVDSALTMRIGANLRRYANPKNRRYILQVAYRAMQEVLESPESKAASRKIAEDAGITKADLQRIRPILREWVGGGWTDGPQLMRLLEKHKDILAKFRMTKPVRLWRNERAQTLTRGGQDVTDPSNRGWDDQYTRPSAWSATRMHAESYASGNGRRLVTAIVPPEDTYCYIPLVEQAARALGLKTFDPHQQDEVIVRPNPSFLEQIRPKVQWNEEAQLRRDYELAMVEHHLPQLHELRKTNPRAISDEELKRRIADVAQRKDIHDVRDELLQLQRGKAARKNASIIEPHFNEKQALSRTRYRAMTAAQALVYQPKRVYEEDVLVTLDVPKVDTSWRRDKTFYIEPGGGNQLRGRYDRFAQWLQDNPGTPIDPPDIGLTPSGEIIFGNGRHRFAVLRDQGRERIAATVPKQDFKTMAERFGAEKVQGTSVTAMKTAISAPRRFYVALCTGRDAALAAVATGHVGVRGVSTSLEGLSEFLECAKVVLALPGASFLSANPHVRPVNYNAAELLQNNMQDYVRVRQTSGQAQAVVAVFFSEFQRLTEDAQNEAPALDFGWARFTHNVQTWLGKRFVSGGYKGGITPIPEVNTEAELVAAVEDIYQRLNTLIENSESWNDAYSHLWEEVTSQWDASIAVHNSLRGSETFSKEREWVTDGQGIKLPPGTEVRVNFGDAKRGVTDRAEVEAWARGAGKLVLELAEQRPEFHVVDTFDFKDAPVVFDFSAFIKGDHHVNEVGQEAKTARTLYHGTSSERARKIEQEGLEPQVGDLVQTAYGDDADSIGYDFEPLVFAGDKEALQRGVYSAMLHAIQAEGHDITDAEQAIRNWGALVILKDGDEVMDHRPETEDPYGYSDHPLQVETGDYYSREGLVPDHILTGPTLVRYLKRNGVNMARWTKPFSEQKRNALVGMVRRAHPDVPVEKILEKVDALTFEQFHKSWDYYTKLERSRAASGPKLEFQEQAISAEASSFEGTKHPGVRVEALLDYDTVGALEYYLDGDNAYVRGITVAPHYRGQGLGQQLYDEGIASARRHGATAFYSDQVNAMSPDAHKAWSRIRQRHPVTFESGEGGYDSTGRHRIDLKTAATQNRVWVLPTGEIMEVGEDQRFHHNMVALEHFPGGQEDAIAAGWFRAGTFAGNGYVNGGRLTRQQLNALQAHFGHTGVREVILDLYGGTRARGAVGIQDFLTATSEMDLRRELVNPATRIAALTKGDIEGRRRALEAFFPAELVQAAIDEAPDTYTMPKDEAVEEHERLIEVLRSPDHTDDLQEADEQAGELRKIKTARYLTKDDIKAYAREIGERTGKSSRQLLEELYARQDEHFPGFVKEASANVFYHGTNAEGDFETLKPSVTGILWLTDDLHAAASYAMKHYHKGPATLWKITLREGAKLVALWDLNDPVVRKIKEQASTERRMTIGSGISDETWARQAADFGMLEAFPWIVRQLRANKVDGVWVHDLHAGRKHLSLALINRAAMVAQEKEALRPEAIHA